MPCARCPLHGAAEGALCNRVLQASICRGKMLSAQLPRCVLGKHVSRQDVVCSSAKVYFGQACVVARCCLLRQREHMTLLVAHRACALCSVRLSSKAPVPIACSPSSLKAQQTMVNYLFQVKTRCFFPLVILAGPADHLCLHMSLPMHALGFRGRVKQDIYYIPWLL